MRNVDTMVFVAGESDQLVSQIRRAALEECEATSCPIHPVLDLCASTAVARYQNSRIKTFVPLLALRQVRDCIRQGSCPDLSDLTSRS